VIGEGEKDEAPMLYSGEKVGKNHLTGASNSELEIDIAVDPLECTSNLANGKPNAMSVLAAGPKGSLMKAPGTYMEQIVVGKEAIGKIDINDTIANNLTRIAKAMGKDIDDITVCILDRPRLASLITEVRKAGARIRLIDHGTVAGAIAAGVDDTGIDVLMGDGGAPETVIIAAAIKCLGGEVQAKLKPHNDKTAQDIIDMGLDINKIYFTNDLARGNELMFVGTGVSDGPLLKGVVFKPDGAKTHSIVMKSKSGSIRWIETYHHFKGEPKY
jgi:fructose-1,6-bisphosphatase II